MGIWQWKRTRKYAIYSLSSTHTFPAPMDSLFSWTTPLQSKRPYSLFDVSFIWPHRNRSQLSLPLSGSHIIVVAPALHFTAALHGRDSQAVWKKRKKEERRKMPKKEHQIAHEKWMATNEESMFALPAPTTNWFSLSHSLSDRSLVITDHWSNGSQLHCCSFSSTFSFAIFLSTKWSLALICLGCQPHSSVLMFVFIIVILSSQSDVLQSELWPSFREEF